MSGLLWVVYLNSLLAQLALLPVHVHAYADDLKLTATDPSHMQAALDVVSKWCEDWQMRMSAPKCVVVPICSGLKRQYLLAGSPLPPPVSSSHRDLGLLITPSLAWSDHVSHVTAKAKSCCFLILRSITCRSAPILIRAYTVYARPLLETCSVVWNNISCADADRVEKTQKWFTRAVYRRCFWQKAAYATRLETLALEPLRDRRLLADLSFTFDVFHGRAYCPEMLKKKVNLRPLIHNARLLSDRSATGSLRTAWPNRIVSLWNAIPEAVIRSSKPAFVAFVRDHVIPRN